jgi:hypothetical protein
MKKLSAAVVLVALGFAGSCGPGLEPPRATSAGDVDHPAMRPPVGPGVGVGAAGTSAAAGSGAVATGRGGSGGTLTAGAGGAAGQGASDAGVDDDAGH